MPVPKRGSTSEIACQTEPTLVASAEELFDDINELIEDLPVIVPEFVQSLSEDNDPVSLLFECSVFQAL